MPDPVEVRASKLIQMLTTEKVKVQEINHFLRCLIDVLNEVKVSQRDPVMFTIPAEEADRDEGGNPDPCCGWCIDNVPPRTLEARSLQKSRKASAKKTR